MLGHLLDGHAFWGLCLTCTAGHNLPYADGEDLNRHVRCLIRCLDPAGARPTAMELLEDPFFAKPKLPPPEVGGRRPSGLPQLEPETPPHGGPNHHQQQDGGASSGSEEACEVWLLHRLPSWLASCRMHSCGMQLHVQSGYAPQTNFGRRWVLFEARTTTSSSRGV